MIYIYREIYESMDYIDIWIYDKWQRNAHSHYVCIVYSYYQILNHESGLDSGGPWGGLDVGFIPAEYATSVHI